MSNAPVIFMAFANEMQEGKEHRYLRGLADEQRALKEALYVAVKEKLCELVVETNATLKTILNTFQRSEYRDRIAVFHYGGHADGYQLLLEAAGRENEVAHGAGLVSFLSSQRGLRFIFLNGCSTQQQAIELMEAGIPAVIGTSQAIADDVATQLATRFYSSIGEGNNLDRAWKEAKDEIVIRKGASNTRGMYFKEIKTVPDQFPWGIHYREGSEIVKEWNLPDAGDNPLSLLPDIPEHYKIPKEPFRFLRRYTREDNRVFFGRATAIHTLYKQVTDPKGKPLVLFYGQSGAGKSSLLDSGLLPRIEDSHEVVYIRRDQQKGLLGTLQEGLGVASRDLNLLQLKSMMSEYGEGSHGMFESLIKELKEKKFTFQAPVKFSEGELEGFIGENLGKVWKKIEDKTGKPLILILDQVEEMYTRPQKVAKTDGKIKKNNVQREEFELFIEALKKLFGNKQDLPKGKLILSYRKEYHPEIEERLRKSELARSTIFLEHLKYKNVKEIIDAFALKHDLRKAYNLKLEEGLSNTIARDLTSNPDAPVAPVLQIVLSWLWEMGVAEDPKEPHFTQANYNQLIHEGLSMRDFFLKQMKLLRALDPNLKQVVDSGLALDLLRFHVTEMGTAGSQKMTKIRDRYSKHEEMIEKLIENCKDLSLLNELKGVDQTLLAHDTLAPIVELEYNESDKSAQRASRILESKIMDQKALQKQHHEEESAQVYLDESDLKVVEDGMKNMRSLSEAEQDLFERSLEERKKRNASKKRNRALLIGMLATLIISSIIFGIVQKNNVDKIREANRVRVERNIVRANEAINRLNYFEAFEYLDESAQMGINTEDTKAGLNELAFIYLQMDSAAYAWSFLNSCLPILDGAESLELEVLLGLARDSLLMDSTLAGLQLIHEARALITDPEQDAKLMKRYYPDFVLVEGGTFMMRTNEPINEDERDAMPAHAVTLSDFKMSIHEITVAQFNLYASQYGAMPKRTSSDWLADHPVVDIPIDQATAYGYWLMSRTGQTFRLPTEAEWEYAARGGKYSKGYAYAGSNSLDSVGWHKGNTNFTKPAHSTELQPNELGLYGMSGNVKEWVSDFYVNYYTPEAKVNPKGPSGEVATGFVTRGGGWASVDSTIHRVTYRFSVGAPNGSYKDVTLGFRMVLEVPIEE